MQKTTCHCNIFVYVWTLRRALAPRPLVMEQLHVTVLELYLCLLIQLFTGLICFFLSCRNACASTFKELTGILMEYLTKTTRSLNFLSSLTWNRFYTSL